MKYTIELTENQATRVNDILLGLNESWGYPKGELKLKPIGIIPLTNNEIYKRGFNDGTKQALDDVADKLQALFEDKLCQSM